MHFMSKMVRRQVDTASDQIIARKQQARNMIFVSRSCSYIECYLPQKLTILHGNM